MKTLLTFFDKHSVGADTLVISANILALLQSATIVINFIAAVLGVAWLIYRWVTRKSRKDD